MIIIKNDEYSQACAINLIDKWAKEKRRYKQDLRFPRNLLETNDNKNL